MSRPHVARARIALAAAAVSVFALAAPASAQVPVTQIESGPTTVDQSVAWSQATFSDGSAPTVIIARDDDFADALASGAVQGALQAPLLLTDTDTLSAATAEEIARLGASDAVVLGGEAAVSPAVVDALADLGVESERIAGETRLETAVAIADRFFPNATEVVLARAFGTMDDPTQAFADTLTVGPYSAAANVPVLLTSTDQLDAPTAAALSALPVARVLVVGGTAAVSDAVADAAATAIDDGDAATDEVVDRVAGATRFDTAAMLNAELGYATGSDATRVLLVEGQASEAWAAGIPAGVQAGNGAATVLANGDELPAETLAFLDGAGVPLICGPTVTQTACDAAAQAMGA